jgi:hypothetical protein
MDADVGESAGIGSGSRRRGSEVEAESTRRDSDGAAGRRIPGRVKGARAPLVERMMRRIAHLECALYEVDREEALAREPVALSMERRQVVGPGRATAASEHHVTRAVAASRGK